MSNIDLGKILKSAGIFSQLPSQVIDALTDDACLVDCDARKLLVHSGDDSRGIHLVHSGLLKLAFYSLQGQEKVIAMLDSGKTFGQAELFSGNPYRYDVRALTRSQLVYIPKASIARAGQRESGLLLALLDSLGRQFDALLQDIKYSVSYSAQQRVLAFLLSRIDGAREGPAEITLAVTKGALASRLGIAPETLSRTLAFLAQNRFLTVDHRQIAVHDVAKLRSLLERSLLDGTSLAAAHEQAKTKPAVSQHPDRYRGWVPNE